jgi:hypothetical protein
MATGVCWSLFAGGVCVGPAAPDGKDQRQGEAHMCIDNNRQIYACNYIDWHIDGLIDMLYVMYVLFQDILLATDVFDRLDTDRDGKDLLVIYETSEQYVIWSFIGMWHHVNVVLCMAGTGIVRSAVAEAVAVGGNVVPSSTGVSAGDDLELGQVNRKEAKPQ